jgi:hypothetical protein
MQATPNVKNPWKYSEQVRTYPANHRRCKIIRARCNILYGPGSLRQVRKYKNEKTGEEKTTVEIEFK